MSDTDIFGAFNEADLASFMEEFYDSEELSDITSLEAAVQYVDEIFNIATITQKQDICFAFCGGYESTDITTMKVLNDNSIETLENQFGDTSFDETTSHKKFGGAVVDGDARLYDLLQVADSYHDFPLEKNPNFIQDDGTNLFETWVDSMNLKLPDGITRRTLRKKNTLIKQLCEKQYLTYETEQVHNPLYRINLDERFEVEKHTRSINDNPNSITFDEFFQKYDPGWNHPAAIKETKWAFEQSNSNVHDVWNVTNKIQNDYRTRPLKLVQVAKLCAAIRATFGNSIEYCLDTTEPLVCLIFALKFCGEALYEKIIQPTDSAKLESFVKSLQLTDQQDVWFKNLTSNLKRSEHKAYICDAHFLDALSVPRDFDIHVCEEPTGNVFTEGYPYQVELMGITYNDAKIAQAKVCITDNNVTRTRPLQRDSTLSSISKAQESIALLKDGDLMNRTFGGLICSKRAGDWGQVESCKRDANRVLITKDRLCALYAIYRGVKVIFMKINTHSEVKARQKIGQYTFTMLDPTSYGISIGDGLPSSAYSKHVDTGEPLPHRAPVAMKSPKGAMVFNTTSGQVEWEEDFIQEGGKMSLTLHRALFYGTIYIVTSAMALLPR